jgi:hypothetical protein
VTDTSLKKTYGWQISTWKDVQHYCPLGECKLTLWDVTIHLAEFLK